MPQLIAFCEVCEHSFVQEAVRIREEADPHTSIVGGTAVIRAPARPAAQP
jgi:hypothetical protein